jgi:4-amino-4-deoxy-L-arabinose transferase-like glycosyltransferase
MPGQATKRPAAGAPGGNGEIGEPGVLRLFSQPLANEIAWLLPFGLFSIGLVAVRERARLPLSDKHKGLVLWGGYLLTAGVFFSIAEFYHAYYLVMMAAPLAALVAMGVSELWNMGRKRPALALMLLALAGLGTIAVQVFIAYKYVASAPWLVLVFGLLTLSGLVLLFSTKQRQWTVWRISAACLVASMLVTPTVWSVLTAMDDSPNINLPSAYEGGVDERAPMGDRRRVNQELLDFLQANTQDVEYLVAVRSSMEGAGMVLETGRPVLYMGGFNGQDPVVSAEDLVQMVEDGELRYVLWGGSNRNAKQSAEIGSWLQSSCVAVEGAGLKQVAQPVPGRAFQAGLNGPPGGAQTGQAVLYQCGE